MAVRTGTGAGEPGGAAGASPTPAFTGALDAMLDSGPAFRSRLRGYDPLEVDAYVSWVESELRTVRREVDDLLVRFGACSAELEISRRMLAEAPRARVVFPVSDRVEEMLQLAADEAAAITEAGAREAEHLVAEARSEADARLRKAHEIKQAAVRAADELREHARAQQAEAQALLDRLAEEAAAERRRLDEEAAREREQAAAAAAAELAELQDEVARLLDQRDRARESLRGLSSRIGEALRAVAAPVAGGDANVAVEGVEYDPALVQSGDPVLRRRPAPVAS